MSDGSLSQDEIDALLQGVDEIAAEPVSMPSATAKAAPSADLSDNERNVILDLIRAQLSTASNTLSTILSKKVEISNPSIEVQSSPIIRNSLPQESVQVRINYTEGLLGEILFILKKSDAAVIADLMMGQDGISPPAEFNELYISAVNEALNQMHSATLNILSVKTGKTIRVNPPQLTVAKNVNELFLPPGDKLVKISSSFSLEGLFSSNFYIIYSLPFIKEIVSLLSAGEVSYAPAQPTPMMPQMGMQMPSAPQPHVMAQPVKLPTLNVSETLGISQDQLENISLLMDVPLQLTVELGRTKMLVKEILGLGEGSIIELDKLAGEPVDLLVNNKLIAKGEVVVIDENFGVRVTDIVRPAERLAGLKLK